MVNESGAVLMYAYCLNYAILTKLVYTTSPQGQQSTPCTKDAHLPPAPFLLNILNP